MDKLLKQKMTDLNTLQIIDNSPDAGFAHYFI